MTLSFRRGRVTRIDPDGTRIDLGERTHPMFRLNRFTTTDGLDVPGVALITPRASAAVFSVTVDGTVYEVTRSGGCGCGRG
jgi:hypothetical protein